MKDSDLQVLQDMSARQGELARAELRRRQIEREWRKAVKKFNYWQTKLDKATEYVRNLRDRFNEARRELPGMSTKTPETSTPAMVEITKVYPIRGGSGPKRGA